MNLCWEDWNRNLINKYPFLHKIRASSGVWRFGGMGQVPTLIAMAPRVALGATAINGVKSLDPWGAP